MHNLTATVKSEKKAPIDAVHDRILFLQMQCRQLKGVPRAQSFLQSELTDLGGQVLKLTERTMQPNTLRYECEHYHGKITILKRIFTLSSTLNSARPAILLSYAFSLNKILSRENFKDFTILFEEILKKHTPDNQRKMLARIICELFNEYNDALRDKLTTYLLWQRDPDTKSLKHNLRKLLGMLFKLTSSPENALKRVFTYFMEIQQFEEHIQQFVLTAEDPEKISSQFYSVLKNVESLKILNQFLAMTHCDSCRSEITSALKQCLTEKEKKEGISFFILNMIDLILMNKQRLAKGERIKIITQLKDFCGIDNEDTYWNIVNDLLEKGSSELIEGIKETLNPDNNPRHEIDDKIAPTPTNTTGKIAFVEAIEAFAKTHSFDLNLNTVMNQFKLVEEITEPFDDKDWHFLANIFVSPERAGVIKSRIKQCSEGNFDIMPFFVHNLALAHFKENFGSSEEAFNRQYNSYFITSPDTIVRLRSWLDCIATIKKEAEDAKDAGYIPLAPPLVL